MGRMNLIEQAKKLLAEERHRIALHDLAARETKRAISLMTRELFSAQGQWSKEEFIDRVKRYEAIVSDLLRIEALLTYWGTALHTQTITSPPQRISDELQPEGGLTGWVALRWYPVLLLLYAGGIAAVAAGRYDNLRLLFHALVTDPDHSGDRVALVLAVPRGLRDAGPAFKGLPGYEKHYTPLSDHLVELLEPVFDSVLFLSADFARAFDEFEVLLALEHAQLYASERGGRVWGPIGRFGWKPRGGDASSPFHRVVAHGQMQGAAWPPIRAGMFQGSIERFSETANEFGKIVSGLGWY